MKLRKVTKAKESGYPTYWNYLRDHKKELGIIAAGVGLLLTPGCEEKNKSHRTAGKPKPPITIPVDKGVELDGDMVAPTPPKPQNGLIEKTPQVGGKIIAPKPQQVAPPGVPPPPKIKGKMAAPQPPEKKKGEIPAVKPQEKVEKFGNVLTITGGVMVPAQPPKQKPADDKK